MSKELYKRYRPRTLSQVKGQPQAVKVLGKYFENGNLPQSILLTGPSGCGKTTLANIILRHLKVAREDFTKINAGSKGGVDTARDMERYMKYRPMGGSRRVWHVEECHQLTNAAQTALLDVLEEEAPDFVYFLLSTTAPEKLLRAIRTRCTEIRLGLLPREAMEETLTEVVTKERGKVSAEVVDRIIDVAEGSARKAMVVLDEAIMLDSEEDQLAAINKFSAERDSVEICRALLNPRTSWQDLAKIIKGVDKEPEDVRRHILGYMAAVMLGGNPQTTDRANRVMTFFLDNFYDSGRAGLVNACYEAWSAK